ncbi:hypothetical protein N0V90_006641 [Kalmusia sp. IMI 367209]|nr:hypothetical protein N0V90_006641 [Kalmusia sp. IMI 367209]
MSEQGFHHLIGAIFLLTYMFLKCLSRYSGIHEFRVDPPEPIAAVNPGSRTTFGLRDFEFAQPAHLESGKYFFRGLHKVVLYLELLGVQTQVSSKCLENLHTLLTEATNLRHLGLHLFPWHRRPSNTIESIDRGDYLPFARLGLTSEWPGLESIDLEGISGSEKQMRNLISRHKTTLASVKLSHCVMTSGRWSSLVDDVVYETKIPTFVLDYVNEANVGNMRFVGLSIDQARQWQYEGEVKENAEGERYFYERPGKSVYLWREQIQDQER